MNGRCLCGAVQITAQDNVQMHACHCNMCRRWSSGPMLAVHSAPGVQIAGDEHITVFRSSEWAERGFCGTCGTHLFYRLLPTGEYFLSAGLFQNGPTMVLHEQIFIDEKPPGYDFANDTPKLTGAEIFAKFTPPG
jgi:hypothetical protein